jgi:ABC-type uncharacterized transport system auxiliary subunit
MISFQSALFMLWGGKGWRLEIFQTKFYKMHQSALACVHHIDHINNYIDYWWVQSMEQLL